MRQAVAFVLAISSFALQATAFQARGDTAGKPAMRACSLPTRDLAMKVSGAVNTSVFDLPPEEQPLGKSGSACDYADITLQIDAFTPERIAEIGKTMAKEWAPISGVGDRAYFRNNANRYAEWIGTQNIDHSK